jgi:hypothetical protein
MSVLPSDFYRKSDAPHLADYEDLDVGDASKAALRGN